MPEQAREPRPQHLSSVDPSRSEQRPKQQPALEFVSVQKSFPGVIALRSVSFDVIPGEVHAILGENGAGKSTLVSIAAGSLQADGGVIRLAGAPVDSLTALERRAAGIAIAYQHPALVPDLSVAENMRLGLSPDRRPAWSTTDQWTSEALASWPGIDAVAPRTQLRELSPGQRYLVEIARAVAQRPKVLILDEPTEHLGREAITALMQRIKQLAAGGIAVIYISHRISEVKSIADRLTILRDGEGQGTYRTKDIDEAEIVRLIVGHSIEHTFPAKAELGDGSRPVPALQVVGWHGSRFSGVDLAIHPGEILGVAGVQGNGQRELLRSLAGLEPARGQASLNGRRITLHSGSKAADAGIAYLPSDRLGEGIFAGLSLRENLSIRSLGSLARGPFVFPSVERPFAARQIDAMRIKAASPEVNVETLSGGNQQRAMLARILSSQPSLILADEPTQGVDVGARSEIYEILRTAADSGCAIALVASDAAELEGLCDRVVVMSRGQLVKEFEGADVTERNITEAAITSSTVRAEGETGRRAAARRMLRSDRTPLAVILLLIILLGAYSELRNPSYLGKASLTELLLLTAALAFVGMAQQAVMFTGALDLSVGPLMGLTVVVSSFVLTANGAGVGWLLGILVVIGVALVVGLSNWALIAITEIPPVAATLITYILIQGVSLVLRPQPAGTISLGLTNDLQASVGFLPYAAIAVVAVAFGLQWLLKRSMKGIELRAVGSAPLAAAQLGVRSLRVLLGAFLLGSVLVALAGLMLGTQVGMGDPSVGVEYTLSSIVACVLGGASVFGGRGSFVGVVLGALALEQIDSLTTFLNLSSAWQYYLMGALALIAVALYSRLQGAEGE